MKKARSLSLLLAAALAFCAFSGSVAADDHIDTEETVILPISDLPETIDREEALARGHVARLKNEEPDMHSVVFRNSDGTKSMYMFASPVKYEDANGTVRDKRTTVAQTAAGYTMTDNDVQTVFPSASANGALIAKADESVTLAPVSAASALAVMWGNTAVYNGVFGSNTMLCLTPLLSGMKSTVVLRTRGESSSFSFNINPNGLTASTNASGAVLLTNEDGEAVFKLGNYIVSDSAGNVIEGEPVLTASSDGCYTVTAEVDSDFLDSENTVYPLAIEISITINTSSTIDDTVIYSEKEDRNYGSRNYHNVGYHSTTYGIGRMLVKFPGLETNTTYLNLTPAQIRSAEFCMYTASNYTGDRNHYSDVRAVAVMPWEEEEATWNSVAQLIPRPDDLMLIESITTTRSGGAKATFDLTGILRLWLHNKFERQCGLMIRSQVENSGTKCRDFCSTEYADSHNGTYMPYLVITVDTANGAYIPIHINIFYDSFFAATAYDPQTGIHIGVQAKISALMTPVIELYKELFGIQISYSVYLYTSPYPQAANCPTATASNRICECSTICSNLGTYHHTNQYNIINYFPNGNTNIAFNLYMVGRKTCLESKQQENVCETVNINNGVAYVNKYKICIFNTYYDGVTLPDYNKIQATIVHEIGHLYGVDDHYNEYYYEHPSKEYTDVKCIYGTNKDFPEVYKPNKICNYCEYTIYDNCDMYNHG